MRFYKDTSDTNAMLNATASFFGSLVSPHRSMLLNYSCVCVWFRFCCLRRLSFLSWGLRLLSAQSVVNLRCSLDAFVSVPMHSFLSVWCFDKSSVLWWFWSISRSLRLLHPARVMSICIRLWNFSACLPKHRLYLMFILTTVLSFSLWGSRVLVWRVHCHLITRL